MWLRVIYVVTCVVIEICGYVNIFGCVWNYWWIDVGVYIGEKFVEKGVLLLHMCYVICVLVCNRVDCSMYKFLLVFWAWMVIHICVLRVEIEICLVMEIMIDGCWIDWLLLWLWDIVRWMVDKFRKVWMWWLMRWYGCLS